MRFSSESVFQRPGVEREDAERVVMATLVAVIAASPIVVTADSTATATSRT